MGGHKHIYIRFLACVHVSCLFGIIWIWLCETMVVLVHVKTMCSIVLVKTTCVVLSLFLLFSLYFHI
jgi:hypothetical protein